MDDETARNTFNLREDVRDWKVHLARADIKNSKVDFAKRVKLISYRPFDTRFTYYTGKSKGLHCMPRHQVMQHFFKRQRGTGV